MTVSPTSIGVSALGVVRMTVPAGAVESASWNSPTRPRSSSLVSASARVPLQQVRDAGGLGTGGDHDVDLGPLGDQRVGPRVLVDDQPLLDVGGLPVDVAEDESLPLERPPGLVERLVGDVRHADLRLRAHERGGQRDAPGQQRQHEDDPEHERPATLAGLLLVIPSSSEGRKMELSGSAAATTGAAATIAVGASTG